jgi:hypothetical protein
MQTWLRRCIVLSCPCPHVRSLSRCAAQLRFRLRPSKPGLPFVPPPRCRCVVSARAIAGPDLMLIAFLEFPGPSTFTLQAQRPALERDLRPALTRTGHTFPASRRPRGFAPPRRVIPQPAVQPCFMPVPSLGFLSFEGFSPHVAPESSRSLVSSVSFPACASRLRGCQHHTDALQSRGVFSARDPRSFPGCYPLRGIDLHGLVPRFRRTPLMGFSGFHSSAVLAYC